MATDLEERSWVEANRRMFGQIVRRYDRMNTVMTFGRDAAWRRDTAAFAAPDHCTTALDMATGTGELAFALANRADNVFGLDISEEMVKAASSKLEAGRKNIRFLVGDGLSLPFPDASFDAAVTGFALRNVADLNRALLELYRVLKPGGRLACLELSKASFRPLAALHLLYIASIVPLLGWLVAGNTSAYRFLSSSLGKFLTPQELQQKMYDAGFQHVEYRLYHLRSVAIHMAVK